MRLPIPQAEQWEISKLNVSSAQFVNIVVSHWFLLSSQRIEIRRTIPQKIQVEDYSPSLDKKSE